MNRSMPPPFVPDVNDFLPFSYLEQALEFEGQFQKGIPNSLA